MKHVDVHITVSDRKQDSRNGKKAKGSSWGKGKKSKKGGKRKITAADRRQDARNGRKAKGSHWK